MNDFFDQIYVINLIRRPDKLIKVLNQLDQYKIKANVIEAVDGYHPENYYQCPQNLSPGAYGYTLTWLKIITDAIDKKYKSILILDDDVIPHKNFNYHFKNWIEQLYFFTNNENSNYNSDVNANANPNIANFSDYWKILLLGATQHTKKPEKINGINAYYPHIVDGSFAVGLNQSIFIELLNQLKNKNQLVDSDILRHFYRKYPTFCFVADPNLIIADVSSSDIRSDRSQEELSKKVQWNLPLFHWPQIKPLVSIIIPCYQAQKTIQICLKSMIHQTYRPLEVILIDDHSADQTPNIVSNIFNQWQYHPLNHEFTFKMIRHHKNQGCYQSRNTGLKHASGDFIAFQDSDDISLPYRIEDQLIALLKHQVEFTTCLILRTHLSKLTLDQEKLNLDISLSRIHGNKHCCRAKVGLATTLIRKQVFDKFGLYPIVKWGGDDLYLRNLFPNLKKEQRMMNYLDQNSHIPGKYFKIPEIHYLSHAMNENNLTYQRLKATQENFLKK